MVPDPYVAATRQWAPLAQRGDLLVNPSCDAEETERLLNDVRRATH